MSSLAQKRNALGRGQVPSNYVPGTAACRRCAVRRARSGAAGRGQGQAVVNGELLLFVRETCVQPPGVLYTYERRSSSLG